MMYSHLFSAHVWLLIFLIFYLIVLEFEEKIEEFTELEMEINGVKSRTAKAYIFIKKLWLTFWQGYAIKDAAVYWMFRKFPETHEGLGYK